MSLLFSPAKIAGLEIKNRFVHSATQEIMASRDGMVTDDLVKRYTNLARGEVGLIIPGDMYVHESGRSRWNQTGIHSDDMIPGLRRLSREVHEHGGKIVFQLAHAGRQTAKKIIGQTPIGPSSVGRDPVYLVKPRAMAESDIEQMIAAFGKAAWRAIEAGADGIRLHAAHGYLINQFLSPFFNHRQDQWGMTDENRFRFLERVLQEVNDSVPKGTPILVKINTDDHTPQPGITPDLAKYYAGRLVRLGIHGVELSSGTSNYSFMNMCRGQVPVQEIVSKLAFWQKPIATMKLNRWVGKYDHQEAYHLDVAKLIKPMLGEVPLFLVGGMRQVSSMEEVLENGFADFISMSRPFLRQPYLVKQIMEGMTDRASCVSCNKCLAALANRSPVRCYYKGSDNYVHHFINRMT